MVLAKPFLLALLTVIPLIIFFWLKTKKQSEGTLIYSDTRILGEIKRARVRFVWLPNLFILSALALMIVSLARPQSQKVIQESTAEGIDIVLAVDISTSMSAEDFKPLNRLHVAKKVVADFIRGRKSDRIGLILFAAHSYIKCPLTLDYNVLLSLIEDIDLATTEEDGTAIGTAIVSSLNRLRSSTAKSKVVILLTDGVNNRGSVSPLDAAQIARILNVKIYTIGVGSNAPARYLVQNPDGTSQHVTALVKIDEHLLKAISAVTGGQYFRATDSASLSEIYKQIGEMEKTKITEKRYVQVGELYRYGSILSFLFLFGHLIMSYRFLLKIP